MHGTPLIARFAIAVDGGCARDLADIGRLRKGTTCGSPLSTTSAS